MRADVVISPEPTTDETSGAVGPVRGGNRACAEFRRRLAGEQPRRPATVAHWLAFRGGGLCLGLGATNARQRRSRAPLWACFCCYIRVRPRNGTVARPGRLSLQRVLAAVGSARVGHGRVAAAPVVGRLPVVHLITRNRRWQLDDRFYSIQRCRCEGCGRPSVLTAEKTNQVSRPRSWPRQHRHPLRLRGLAYLAVDESNQLVGGEGLRG